ncbi:hypothetical protein OHS33_31695 [Streptomyces sp. NBC_00536]|uniref:hypothetical protein n=1 Tax=Streptomyces sp. NBC_00536 TaxID=2975769 RepID=UPI002E8152DC|nr:hypothetical protein [Streptomyces sp. NBC_00536]WUC82521.1 hypothetical protein OHS33_31695 [Streptomyces sp. NBC_00536]
MQRKRSIPQQSGGQTLLRITLAIGLVLLCLLIALLVYREGGSVTLDVVGFALTLAGVAYSIRRWAARERRARRIRREHAPRR